MASRILVLFAHPAIHRSRVNARLIEAVRDLPGVTVHDLYETYPAFDIDPDAEQALLAEHDVIVWQHPFYWYSCPALLKEWLDVVLEFGWAYGPNGDQLKGKKVLSVISAGGPEEAYQKDGSNHFTMAELMSPLHQTALLCGMQWLDPLIVHAAHRLTDDDLARAAADYRQRLIDLTHD